jgi:hypothetical protein
VASTTTTVTTTAGRGSACLRAIRKTVSTVASTTSPLSQATPGSPKADSVAAISIWLAHWVGTQSRLPKVET